MKVGFIGLGNIGMPMAKTLLTAGFDLTVHNRSRGKVEEMVALGAKAASSTAEIVETTDTLLACLPDKIAYGALFFVTSDEASFITGSELVIDGGYTAQY